MSSPIRGWLRCTLVVVGWIPALRVRSRTSLTCSSTIIVMTVPLARFTDWLQRRYAERERAGAR